MAEAGFLRRRPLSARPRSAVAQGQEAGAPAKKKVVRKPKLGQKSKSSGNLRASEASLANLQVDLQNMDAQLQDLSDRKQELSQELKEVENSIKVGVVWLWTGL